MCSPSDCPQFLTHIKLYADARYSEAAIWSNVAACAITGSTDTKVESAQQPKVIQIGIRAAKCCLEMKDLASVGIIKKACMSILPSSSSSLSPHETTSCLAVLFRTHTRSSILNLGPLSW